MRPTADCSRARAAGAQRRRVGEQVPGEIGGGVEQERVVLGEIPLHVVAGLVHPVAEAEDRVVDAARAPSAPMRSATPIRRPQQRHEKEVGAVVAIAR